jgi:hypothetical protein
VVEGTRLDFDPVLRDRGGRKALVGCADAENDPFSEGHASTTEGVGASTMGVIR